MVASTDIEYLQNATLETLENLTAELADERFPFDYIQTLNAEDKIDSLRACIIVHNITSGKIVPRPVQLQASLALLHESDVLITAGTGSGKTLCLLLPMLLRPRSMSITISPLKCLQATQVRLDEV